MLNLNLKDFWACSILWSSGLYCLLLPRAALCLWHCVRTLSPPLGVIPPPNQTWGLTLLFSYLSCLCSTNSQVLVSVHGISRNQPVCKQIRKKKHPGWSYRVDRVFLFPGMMGFGFAVFSQMSSTLLIGKVGQTFLRRPHNCNVIIFTSFVIKIVSKDKHLQVCGYSCENKCNQILVFLVCLLTFLLLDHYRIQIHSELCCL